MYDIANENSRLGWLLGRLANRRNRIVELAHRITGLGYPAALKPSLFAKFLHMLDDVAAASKEEAALIGRIVDIEQRHLDMKELGRLRQAVPSNASRAIPANQDEPEQPEKASSYRLMKLIVIWYLLLRQKRNQKKQGFAVD